MISFLQGKPLIHTDSLTILVNGVGYDVKVNTQTLTTISTQEKAELHIYTHVKEDTLDLYGFVTRQEKEMFELVLGVSGVGPATALHVISQGTGPLIDAVQNAQVSFFKKVPRVGKKLAQKIIIELTGKLGQLKALDLGPKSTKHQEISDALISLGFDEDAINDVLATIEVEEHDVQSVIKLAIKNLS